MREEGRTLRQKVRMKWVQEGDASTSLYHRVGNGRRRIIEFKELELERGTVELDSDAIGHESLTFIAVVQ